MDSNAARSAHRSVGSPVASNVPNILHRNRVRRKVAGLNTAVVVARNQAAAVIPSSRSAAIVKAATNGISPAARPAMSDASVRADRYTVWWKSCKNHGMGYVGRNF